MSKLIFLCLRHIPSQWQFSGCSPKSKLRFKRFREYQPLKFETIPIGAWQFANIMEIADCWRKRTYIWDSSCSSRTHMGCLWPCSVQGYFGVTRYPYYSMACKSKWLAIGRSTSKFGSRGTSRTYLDYLWPRSVHGHFEVILCTCLKMACISSTVDHTAELLEFWVGKFGGTSRTNMWYLWPCSTQSCFEVIRCTCLSRNDLCYSKDGVRRLSRKSWLSGKITTAYREKFLFLESRDYSNKTATTFPENTTCM